MGGDARDVLVECGAMDWPLRFGIFLAPFHPVGQNPTLALERDLELVVRLDELGFDEAWFGEHHSAGYEIIASPEVFIGVLSQRTKNIRLGTGVSSLPYHHPFILADRMVLLDHLTRGRVMFGVGPGALPSDAFMMGIDPMNQRDMMEESLEAILALLDGGEPVTREASWFTLRNARLQLRPYTHPRFEVAVAAQISPAGPRAAGRFGLSLLSIGATSAGGFDVLGSHWQVMEERAAEFGTDGRSSQMAAGRAHAHRRDRGAGACRREVRPGPVGGLLRARRRSAPGARARSTPTRWSTPSWRRASPSWVPRPWPSPRSSGWWRSPEGSAPTCSWRTNGPTARQRCGPTSCSPARSCRISRGHWPRSRAHGTGPPRTVRSSSGPWVAPSCRPSRTITPSVRPSRRK